MKNLIGLGSLVVLVGLVGCGDDTGGSTTNNGGSGNDGGGGTGNAGAGGVGNDGGDGGDGGVGNDGGMGGGGMGGGGMGGAGAGAEEFCAEFDTTCGFGEGYADLAACVAAYNGYSPARQECVETHVALAASAGIDPHCSHAAGASPCN